MRRRPLTTSTGRVRLEWSATLRRPWSGRLLIQRPPCITRSHSGGRVEAELLDRDLDHLAGEPPFVVVPAHHLDQVAADDPGHVELDDGGTGVLDDVGRDELLVGDGEDPLVPVGGGLLAQDIVDLFRRGVAVEYEYQVRQRADDHRAADRDTVEAALHGRQRFGGGGGRAGARRDEVLGGG